MSKYATLKYADKNIEIELPVYPPSLGNDCIDVSSLVKHGVFTYDPGFMSTAACESKITYIDGGKGIFYTEAIQSKNGLRNQITETSAML